MHGRSSEAVCTTCVRQLGFVRSDHIRTAFLSLSQLSLSRHPGVLPSLPQLDSCPSCSHHLPTFSPPCLSSCQHPDPSAQDPYRGSVTWCGSSLSPRPSASPCPGKTVGVRSEFERFAAVMISVLPYGAMERW